MKKIILKQFEIVIIVVLVILSAAVYYLLIANQNPMPPPPPTVALTPHQEQAISILIEMDKLLISLSTFIIGIGGAFLLKKFNIDFQFDLFQRGLFVLMYYFAALSIYCGYVLYDKMVEMLGNCCFDANHEYLIQLPQMWQYCLFIFSLVAFSLFVIRGIKFRGSKIKNNEEKNQ